MTGGQVSLGFRVNFALRDGTSPPRAIYRFSGDKVCVGLDLIEGTARLNEKKNPLNSQTFIFIGMFVCLRKSENLSRSS